MSQSMGSSPNLLLRLSENADPEQIQMGPPVNLPLDTAPAVGAGVSFSPVRLTPPDCCSRAA